MRSAYVALAAMLEQEVKKQDEKKGGDQSTISMQELTEYVTSSTVVSWSRIGIRFHYSALGLRPLIGLLSPYLN